MAHGLRRFAALTALALLPGLGARALGAMPPAQVDVLRPVAALPAHVVNQFTNAVAFAQARDGQYVALDRRDHAVYVMDATGNRPRRLLEVGYEPGRILQPSAIALGGDDILVVADSPNGVDRVQHFSMSGLRLGGFFLPLRSSPRLTIGDLVLDGRGSIGFTGKTFLVNQPDWGGLFTEFDATGQLVQQIGVPRTSPGSDREVTLAMNVGIPVASPDGGFFFVFQTGLPVFRKYDARGRLQFERHIEGPELDGRIQALPTTWPARAPGTHPLLPALVRTAATDPQGNLWISLTAPFTYVYGPTGEKLRTVQFQTTDFVSPTSLFFTPRGRLLIAPGGYEFEVH